VVADATVNADAPRTKHEEQVTMKPVTLQYLLAAAIGVFAMAAPPAAYAFDGADLAALCQRTDAASTGGCAAYIAGAADAAHTTIEAIGGTTGPKVGQYFCLPPEVTSRQMVEAVGQFMRGNPEKLGFHASTVIVLGLQDAFPCKGAKP
jgi:hypothetical protein